MKGSWKRGSWNRSRLKLDGDCLKRSQLGRSPQWLLGLVVWGTAILPGTGFNSPAFAQVSPGTDRPAAGTSAAPVRGELSPPFRAVLKSGSRGAEVSELQATLKLLGYFDGTVDGVYGQSTVTAVSQFQKAAGLNADGVAGPATWNRLFPPTPPVSSGSGTAAPGTSASTFPVPSPGTFTTPGTPSPTPRPTQSPTPREPKPSPSAAEPISLPILRIGLKGPAVNALQERLRSVGVFRGAIDGVFGQETQTAVKAAQRKFNLDPDGVVGPATWNALLR